MASSASNARDEQLLSVGKQCSHPTCHLVDFLPFKCQHCAQSFCQEHFKVEDHQCSKYDATKHNRIAPNCPLCNTPVAVRPGQDPNERMDIHLDQECSVVVGKKRSSTSPRCHRPACNKVLFSPIRCDQCRQQFCPAHRFPTDHSCAPPAKQTTQTTLGSKPMDKLQTHLNSNAKILNAKASAAGNAALKSVKQSIASASSSPTPPGASASRSTTTTPASKSKPSIPFNKVDRRAKAERESKLKAMRERAKKGLLNEQELANLAAEEAAAKDNKDCVIM